MFNISVWVLMVFSHGGALTPTIEFNDREKCEAAVIAVKSAADSVSTILIGSSRKPICIKIEK